MSEMSDYAGYTPLCLRCISPMCSPQTSRVLGGWGVQNRGRGAQNEISSTTSSLQRTHPYWRVSREKSKTMDGLSQLICSCRRCGVGCSNRKPLPAAPAHADDWGSRQTQALQGPTRASATSCTATQSVWLTSAARGIFLEFVPEKPDSVANSCTAVRPKSVSAQQTFTFSLPLDKTSQLLSKQPHKNKSVTPKHSEPQQK